MNRKVIVVASVVGVLLVGCIWWSLPGELACKNTQRFTKWTSDRAFKAVVFERDCGATTDTTCQVSILPGWQQLPNASGNTFSESAPYREGANLLVDVRWESSNHLVVRHDLKARVFRKKDVVDVWRGWALEKVVVKYEPVDGKQLAPD